VGNLFGEFFCEVAMGNQPSKTLTLEESHRLYQEIAEELAPKILALREEERQAWQEAAHHRVYGGLRESDAPNQPSTGIDLPEAPC